MKRIVLIYGLLLCLALSVAAQEKVVKLKIVETSGRGVWHGFILSCRKSASNIRRI